MSFKSFFKNLFGLDEEEKQNITASAPAPVASNTPSSSVVVSDQRQNVSVLKPDTKMPSIVMKGASEYYNSPEYKMTQQTIAPATGMEKTAAPVEVEKMIKQEKIAENRASTERAQAVTRQGLAMSSTQLLGLASSGLEAVSRTIAQAPSVLLGLGNPLGGRVKKEIFDVAVVPFTAKLNEVTQNFVQKKISENPLWQRPGYFVDDSTFDGVKENLKRHPQEYVSRVFAEQVPLFGGAILAALTGGAPAGGALTGILGAGEQFQDASSKGIEPNKAARLSVMRGVVEGTLDAIGLDAILGHNGGKVVYKGIVDKFVSRLLEVGKATSVEALTEGAQEAWANAVTRTYDETRGRFDNVWAAMFSASMFGGAASVIHGVGEVQEMPPVMKAAITQAEQESGQLPSIFADAVEQAKQEQPIEDRLADPTFRVNTTLYQSANGQSVPVNVNFQNVLAVSGDQHTLVQEMADAGVPGAQAVLDDFDYFEADNFIREALNGTPIDAIRFTSADTTQSGESTLSTEFFDLKNNAFLQESGEKAKTLATEGYRSKNVVNEAAPDQLPFARRQARAATEAQIRQFATRNELPVRFVREMFVTNTAGQVVISPNTGRPIRAFGAYDPATGIITISDIAKGTTAKHEVAEFYWDRFVTEAEKKAILAEARKTFGNKSDAALKEDVMDAFAEYRKTGKTTLRGKIKELFQKVLKFIKNLGKLDKGSMDQFFQNIEKRVRPATNTRQSLRLAQQFKTERQPKTDLGEVKTGQEVALRGYAGVRKGAKDSGFRAMDKDVAESYAIERGGAVREFTDTLENPFVTSYQTAFVKDLADKGNRAAKDLFARYSDIVAKKGGTANTDAIVQEMDAFIQSTLSKQGFDSVVYKTTNEYQTFAPAMQYQAEKADLAPVLEEAKSFADRESFLQEGIKPFHSLHVTDLDRIKAAGGKLISPSFGIAKSVDPIYEFGDITLVVPMDLFKRTRVFTRDIGSPRPSDLPETLYIPRKKSEAIDLIREFADDAETILTDGIKDSVGGDDAVDRIDRFWLANDMGLDANRDAIAERLGLDDPDNTLEELATGLFEKVEKTPEGIQRYMDEIVGEGIIGGEPMWFGTGAAKAAEELTGMDLIEEAKKRISRTGEIDKNALFETQLAVKQEIEEALDRDVGESGLYSMQPTTAGELAAPKSYEEFAEVFYENFGKNAEDVFGDEEAARAIHDKLRRAFAEIPTEYFEAKSSGSFDLNEFPAAVVRNEEAGDALREAGFEGQIFNGYEELYDFAKVGKPRRRSVKRKKQYQAEEVLDQEPPNLADFNEYMKEYGIPESLSSESVIPTAEAPFYQRVENKWSLYDSFPLKDLKISTTRELQSSEDFDYEASKIAEDFTAKEMKPIYAVEENGEYRILDGNHTKRALEMLGEDSGKAIILRKSPIAEVPDSQLPNRTPDQERALDRFSDVKDARERAMLEKEIEIINAREADISFSDDTLEEGYQQFKKLVQSRKWLLDARTDEAIAKRRIPSKNLDNTLFHGIEITNDEALDLYKERFTQEKELKTIARQKTPSELKQLDKKTLRKYVKPFAATKAVTKKAVSSLVKRPTSEVVTTDKQLLKNRIQTLARGIREGRVGMKREIQAVAKQIVSEAKEKLPPAERGKVLMQVARAVTPAQMEKAITRISEIAEVAERKQVVSDIKKTIKQTKKAMQSGSGIAVEYQKKIMDAVKSFDPSNPTADTIERLTKLAEFLQSEAGKAANVPEKYVKQLERLNKTSPGAMTTQELKDLSATLDHLVELGRTKLQLLENASERQQAKAVADLVSTTRNLDGVMEGKVTDWQKKKASWKRQYFSALHFFRVADAIDGYREYKGQNVQLQRLGANAETRSKIDHQQTNLRVMEKINAIKPDWTEEEQAALTYRLMVDMGGDDQAQSLVETYGAKIVDLANQPVMKQVADIVRAPFAERQSKLAAVYEQLTNKPFDFVENYFPLKYQKTADTLYEEPSLDEILNQGGFRTSKTEQGFTKSRVKGVTKIPRIDFLNVFSEATGDQLWYTNVQPVLTNIKHLVFSPEYQRAAGETAVQLWRDWISNMAKQGRTYTRYPVVRTLRFNVGQAVLGYKLTSVAIQPFAIFEAVGYVQQMSLPKGFSSKVAAARVVREFTKSWVNPWYARNAKEQSEMLRLRAGGEFSIQEGLDYFDASKRKSLPGRAYAAFQRGALKVLQAADIKTAAGVRQGVYKTFLKTGMSAEQAAKEADFVMNIVSGSSEVADRPLLLTNEAGKAVFTFQSYALNVWGLLSQDIIRSGIVGGKIGRKASSVLALAVFAFGQWLADKMRDELNAATRKDFKKPKDDQPLNSAVWDMLFYVPEQIPVIGGMIESARKYKKFGFDIPIARPAEDLFAGLSGLVSADSPEKRAKAAKKVAEGVASLLGVSGTAQFFDLLPNVIPALQPAPVKPKKASSGRSRTNQRRKRRKRRKR